MSDRTREMATVRENSRILDGYYKMTLHAPVIAQRCRPGQFVFIRVGSGTAPLLRSFFEYLFINCLHFGSRRQGRKSFRNFKKILKSF